ncbi:MAG: hypothetical protein AVO35_07190 [Candidatus Aegiribacteria sp. MLS_C]|nr:MAG: hypothetical protein AVO35_07190 [Candidatus Aegiribacteria sp. MLS_C]
MSTQELEQLESEWVSNPSPIICARFADLLRQSGRYDEAFRTAEEGLRKWAGNNSISVVLGKSYMDAGLYEKALQVFEKVKTSQPQNLVMLRSIAEIHYELEDWDSCAIAYEEYLFENPADGEAREMQEKARSMKGMNIESLFDSGPGEETESPLVEDDDDLIFPDTDRMKKVLESQGFGSEGTDGLEEGTGREEEAGEGGGSPDGENPEHEGSEGESAEGEGADGEGTDGDGTDGDGTDGYPIEADSFFDRSAPASLLEFFTEDEKRELRLEAYDGED